MLVVGKCMLFGGLDSRRRRLHVLAIFLSVFPSSFYFGVPSLVGDAFFGMDSGVKRFNKGTSAYPVSIFEKYFPRCDLDFTPEYSGCHYVHVSGAREQWRSNGLYVKTGECNGANHYECSNCIFTTPLDRHLFLKKECGLFMCEWSWVINEDREDCDSPYYNLESCCGNNLFCNKWIEAFLNESLNYNVTVECVDEELCGPGYRNATRRAWTWLSWQCSGFLFLWIMIVTFLSLGFAIGRGAVLVFEARHEIRQYVSGLYDRLCNVREVTRLRANLAAERARADRLAVELATLRGMNHMCTALANRVGAYNS